MFLINHVFVGTRFFDVKRRLMRMAGFEVGKGSKIVGPLLCTGKLKIGQNSWIGRDLTIHGNGSVEIGDNCDVAPAVMFLTGGHVIGDSHRRAGQGEHYKIRVGNGCWIGARSTLGRNISVGDGALVAACACVMADVVENTLVGGVPAKMIREL